MRRGRGNLQTWKGVASAQDVETLTGGAQAKPKASHPRPLLTTTAPAGRSRARRSLTRNLRSIAFETLDAIGLRDFFEDDEVLGRDEAPPKPDPGGVESLLRRWGAQPREAVMVGDYVFDLQAGRAAGATTIYIDPEGEFPHRDHADHCIRRLADLL